MVSECSSEGQPSDCSAVLILIMLEYGLGGLEPKTVDIYESRLNPYYAGIWSRSVIFTLARVLRVLS